MLPADAPGTGDRSGSIGRHTPGRPPERGGPRGVLEERHAMMDILTQSEVLWHYPSIEGPRTWPEGSVYRFDKRGHELLRIVRGADAKLVAAVSAEPVE